ncbi:MAG: beta-lactamase family protein [Microcella sp.]|uniref:serine hydrolase domain-containing protein n=1 Tax=Microcella sp. TaxID=1913979 RepID=UPI0024C8F7DC|nr:serine hydrolase domain-containing protein [Microcella sp.]UYN83676.1 MAG: beta-lactamase family protein [Microcella sp.]
MTPEVGGTVAPGFEPVAAAFAEAFSQHDAMGAALAVRADGRPVVDLWGGVADARTSTPWSDSTVSVIFSCTKGLMAILAAKLVQEGRLDYEAPVAEYWPEFAQAGKEKVLVRHVLAHRSGLSAPVVDFSTDDLLDWSTVTSALAAQRPLWAPGYAHSYHAITHGWLIGEVIRRITGATPGDWFRTVITDPLGVDAWIGAPATIEPRIARLSVGETLRSHVDELAAQRVAGVVDWPDRAMTMGGALPPTLVDGDEGFNDPRLHAAQIPAAGAIASASALATIWSATVVAEGGVRLLDADIVNIARRSQSDGQPFYPAPAPWPRWGMGFQLDSEARRYLTAHSFGHDGAGGQVAFADPVHRIGFAFTTNVMEAVDQRATRIIDALRECVSS